MRILGIDPGYDLVGFGCIDKLGANRYEFIDGGVIKTDREVDYWQRVKQIADDLEQIIADCQPDVCVIESLFFAQNTTTAMQVSQARGVIGYLFAKANLPIYEYTPLQIKMALTADGRAEKWQVQTMVQKLLDLPELPQPDDFADALAVALTHA